MSGRSSPLSYSNHVKHALVQFEEEDILFSTEVQRRQEESSLDEVSSIDRIEWKWNDDGNLLVYIQRRSVHVHTVGDLRCLASSRNIVLRSSPDSYPLQ